MRLANFAVAIGTLALLLPAGSRAVSDQQYRAIETLGELNGVALQCGFFPQTKNIKKALVETLPKRRALGQSFEEITHRSFLEFANSGHICPSDTDFSRQVETAIGNLEQAFRPE